MVARKLSLYSLLLALPLIAGVRCSVSAQEISYDADVIISDDSSDVAQSNRVMRDTFVVPTQLRQGAGARGRTAAAPASMSALGQRTPQQFSVRLARAPNMMGDFFSLPGQTATIGELFTGQGTPFTHQGLAVHQTVQSGSSFADDNISIITTDSGTGRTVFLGGPGGVTAGTFFEPSIPPSQIQNPQTGLRLDGDNVNFYTAVLNGDTADVFDNPAVTPATIPNAPVYQVFQVSESVGYVGPNPGDLVGRVRIQDNNKAMPTDRIFIDYNYFHNVPFTTNGIDVNRVTPGIEKTFFDEMTSVEIRVPMAVTFNSNQFQAVGADTSEPEFGNVVIIPKVLLTSNDEMALAAGLGISLPTADNLDVFGVAGPRILSVENESVHLIPFLGYMFTPRDADCFFQSFLTVDVDANGNAVNADIGAGSLEQIGVWNDQTLFSASGTFGHYLFQNDSRDSIVKSISAIGELHYTGTVSDADTVNAGPFLLGNSDRDISVLNATFGGHVRLQDSTLTTGYSVPLTSSDRIFDGELRVFINQFF